MELKDMSDKVAFVIRKPCGCVTAIACVNANRLCDTADWLNEIRKRDDEILLVTLEEARDAVSFCYHASLERETACSQ